MAIDVRLTFPGAGVSGFEVQRYDLEDTLNALFELTLEVLSTDPELDPLSVVGEAVVVDLEEEPFLKRVHGLVRRVRQLSSEPTGVSQYELVVVPPLWLTTRSTDHRIFQDLAADEVCRAVASGYGGRVVAPSVLAASPDRPKRAYRVQYGETDCDFMFRALSEEGWVSFFDYGVGSTAWTITEETAFTDDGAPRVPFVPPVGAGRSVPGPKISAVAITSSMETSTVTIRDYDWKRPDYVLEQRAETAEKTFARERSLERYEFATGRFAAATEKQGAALARQTLDEARSGRRVLACEANFSLGAGSRFTVEDHPRGDVNVQLLVVRASCSVGVGADGIVVRRHALTCVPASDPWRPARRPKPRIFGTQIAFVVGNQAGVDEIDVDEHGRVKVEFRWDRRDLHAGNPTRFVRVSQGWAGLDYGMVMLPRVNEEVIIAYLDGDPDEPVVVGRLHNASSVSPLKLPAEKTRSIWKSKTSPGGEGFNQIMMEDKKGEELLELHAHRDHLVTVGANQTVDVGGDQKIHVGGARDDRVEGAVKEEFDTSLTTVVDGPQDTTAGDVIERYGSQDTTIDGLHKETFGTSESTGGDVVWRVGVLDWQTKQVDWTLDGPGYIKAPSFTIDAPEFKVVNAGSHKDVKGVWDTVNAIWEARALSKTTFAGVDIKYTIAERKYFAASLSAGGIKTDMTVMKIDRTGFKLQNNAVDMSSGLNKVQQFGFSAVVAGLISFM